MSFNASVMFTGLCAFVPSTNGGGMTCLLVNARIGGGLVSNPEHAHTPFVEFDVRNIELPAANMTLPMIEVLQGNTGVWLLNQEDLTLRVVGGQNKFEFPDSNTIGETPTEADKHLLAWVAHMEYVSQGAGPVREDLLGGDSQELRKRVAARLKVSNGRLRTMKHTQATGGAYLRWQFKADEHGPISRTQTLAEIVELKLNGLDEIILEAKRYDERQPTRQLRLRNKTGEPRLTMSFKNIELEQIFSTFGTADNKAVLEDFVYFYELAADASAERNIPHKHPDPPLALSRPICPGAVFQSHASALMVDAENAPAKRKGSGKG